MMRFAPTGRQDIDWGSTPNTVKPIGISFVPQSLSKVLVHLVFSVKHRHPLLHDEFRDRLHAYIGGIIRNHKGHLLRAGSVEDHIHLFYVQPRTSAPCDLVQAIKADSSAFLRSLAPHLANFHWQTGYGLFSVSSTHRAQVEAYIDRQREHHGRENFQDEFRDFLKRYEIEYDERYVWD